MLKLNVIKCARHRKNVEKITQKLGGMNEDGSRSTLTGRGFPLLNSTGSK